jgi:hypothetical protein
MNEIDELRNKLTPIKNYLALQKEYEEIKKQKAKILKEIKESKLGVLISPNKLSEIEKKQAQLLIIIKSELKQANFNMPIIEDLINKLEE